MRIFRKEWSTKRFYEQKFFYNNIDRFREKIRETLKLVLTQTQVLRSNSIADSLNLNFLIYFAELSSCFFKEN